MSVRFLLGPAGSGKTWHCLAALRELERARQSGIYLVPEQFTYSADRELLDGSGLPGLRHVQVLSFSRLGYRLREDAGAPVLPLLPVSVRPMLLRAVMMRMEPEILGPLLALRDRQGLLEELGRFVAEVRAHGAPEFLATVERAFRPTTGREPERAAARRLRALAEVFGEYDRALRDLGRCDPEANLAGIEVLIARDRERVARWTVFVDGFLSWTRREREVLVALALAGTRLEIALCLEPSDGPGDSTDRLPFAPVRRSYERIRAGFEQAGVPVDPPCHFPSGGGASPRYQTSTLGRLERRLYDLGVSASASGDDETTPSASDDVVLRPARSPRAEVQLWARLVDVWLRLDRSPVRPEEIAIIVRDLEPYRSFVREIFPRYRLPVFIDERRGLLAHPRVRLTLDALEVLLSGWRREAVISYLRNPLLAESAAEIDLLEFVSLEYGRDFDAWHAARWEGYALPARARFARAAEEGSGSKRDEEGDNGEDEGEEAVDEEEAEETAPGLFGAAGVAIAGGDSRAATAGTAGDGSAADLRARLFAACDALRSRRLHPLRELEVAWAQGDADGPRMAADLRAFLGQAAGEETVTTEAGDPEWDRLAERELETVLDEAAGLWAGVRVELEEFARTLRQGLASARVGVTPLRLGQVVVAEIQRSRLHGIRRAIVGGLNEGRFPRIVGDDPILPDRDRGLLAAAGIELGPPASARQEEETYLTYIALTRASERIVLTWSRMDEQGAALGPSPLLDEVRRALPGAGREEEAWVVPEMASPESAQTEQELGQRLVTGLAEGETDPILAELWDRVSLVSAVPASIRTAIETARPALEFAPASFLDRELMERVFPEETIVSGVSRLREFAECPFLGFARRLLVLKPRPLAAVTPLETGTLAHAALDRFFREPLPDRPDQIRDRLVSVFDSLEHLDEYRAFRVDEASRYRWDSTRRNLERFLRVETHRMRHSGYRVAAREAAFGPAWGNALELPLPDGGRLVLAGRIDRLDLRDRREGGPRAVVIDYKRSDQKGLPTSLREGLDLQLASYLLVVRDVLGHEVGGGLYLPVLIAPRSEEKLRPEAINPLGITAHGIYLQEEADSIDGGSGIVPGPRSKQALASGAELSELLETGRNYLTQYAAGLRRGLVRPVPLEVRGRGLPCVYCDFGAVCRYRPGVDPIRRKPLEGMGEMP